MKASILKTLKKSSDNLRQTIEDGKSLTSIYKVQFVFLHFSHTTLIAFRLAFRVRSQQIPGRQVQFFLTKKKSLTTLKELQTLPGPRRMDLLRVNLVGEETGLDDAWTVKEFIA